MEPFWIRIHFQGRWFRLLVEQLPDEAGKERWQVKAANKTLLLTNNRPVFRRYRLKHRVEKVKWANEGDEVGYSSFLELIISAIEKRLNEFKP